MTYFYTQHSLGDCLLQSLNHLIYKLLYTRKATMAIPVCKNYNLDSLLKFGKFPYLYWTSTTRPKPSALNNTFSFWPLIAS